jgi:hypothetical protein
VTDQRDSLVIILAYDISLNCYLTNCSVLQTIDQFVQISNSLSMRVANTIFLSHTAGDPLDNKLQYLSPNAPQPHLPVNWPITIIIIPILNSSTCLANFPIQLIGLTGQVYSYTLAHQ